MAASTSASVAFLKTPLSEHLLTFLKRMYQNVPPADVKARKHHIIVLAELKSRAFILNSSVGDDENNIQALKKLLVRVHRVVFHCNSETPFQDLIVP